jgi:CheY-like chemotaxis protein
MAHILIVDDQAANRDLLGYLLGSHGHAVTIASGGAEALRVALADPPDLIVMDIEMHGMDGYTAAGLMRSEDALRDVPLIAVSATGTATPKRAEVAGFDAFYPIPIDPRKFVGEIESFLSGRRPAEDSARSDGA